MHLVCEWAYCLFAWECFGAHFQNAMWSFNEIKDERKNKKCSHFPSLKIYIIYVQFCGAIRLCVCLVFYRNGTNYLHRQLKEIEKKKRMRARERIMWREQRRMKHNEINKSWLQQIRQLFFSGNDHSTVFFLGMCVYFILGCTTNEHRVNVYAYICIQNGFTWICHACVCSSSSSQT